MVNFFELTLLDLAAWLEQQNEKPFHARQIFDWVYGKGVFAFEEMSNLGKELRGKLAQAFRISTLELVKMTESSDHQTFKFLWKLHDGNLVESVLICSSTRRTVCVSSQVGCPAKCAFCASGKGGFFRNLRSNEIVEQVAQINRWLQPKGERVCHIVYMGMGEPFKNYDAVTASIRLISAPEGLNTSQRRITVSTVLGVIEGIKRLTHDDLKIKLVLSLHAPQPAYPPKDHPLCAQIPHC